MTRKEIEGHFEKCMDALLARKESLVMEAESKLMEKGILYHIFVKKFVMHLEI
jgi:hypothetical protein